MWFIKIHVVLLFYTKVLFNSREKTYEVYCNNFLSLIQLLTIIVKKKILWILITKL